MKFAVLGYGGRGEVYSKYISMIDNAEVTAVCDSNETRLVKAKELLRLKNSELFISDTAFFEQGRLADVCIISTQDSLHKKHALSAIAAGYDILLEKPIATTEADCIEIYKAAKKAKRNIFVCHVLRYANFFSIIKHELMTNTYGNIITINITENVGYWHYAHSYVRGNWRNSTSSCPMIIAKCCHDLDIISWFMNAPCVSVSSFGALSYFYSSNAPKNCSTRCLNCDIKANCPYDAERFYITEGFKKGKLWPAEVLTDELSEQNLYQALKTGPYGRCVFYCDNDVVDHQVVNMLFANNATAHLTMTGFSHESYRTIHVHAEKGDIYGDMLSNKINCQIYGKSSKTIDVNNAPDINYGHGGGDYLLIKNIVDFYLNQSSSISTSIMNSMQSHFIGFAAEKSRLNQGAPVKVLCID